MQECSKEERNLRKQLKSYFKAEDVRSEEFAQDHTGIVVAKRETDSRSLEPQSNLFTSTHCFY